MEAEDRKTPGTHCTKTATAASSSSSTTTISHAIMILLRTLLVDSPLIVLFVLYAAGHVLQHVETNYFSVLMKHMEFTEERKDVECTSYHYTCTPDDISTKTADDLLLSTNTAAKTALNKMQRHGAIVIPEILTNTTAHAVREFVLEENKVQEGFYVIENDHRYSFGLKANQHPSLQLALKEIAEHQQLSQILALLVGSHSAVIEFTAITSEYGAAQQNFHQDVVAGGSAAKYARSFIPSYSLFIPLQDTTELMGATSICAGTQLCANEDDLEGDLCQDNAFPVSGSQDNWKQGYGALVNQQTTHRGTAHNDPNGPSRVVLILTLAPRPLFQPNNVANVESRMLGQGGSYSIDWRHWGFTLEDYGKAATEMVEPWLTLRALGIYKPATSTPWGWDGVSVALMRMSNGDNGYTRESLEEFVLEKGGFAWLPTWLQGDFVDYNGEEYVNEDLEIPLDGGWYTFLVTTVRNLHKFVGQCHQTVLGLVILGVLLVSFLTARKHENNKISTGTAVLAQHFGRILVLHGIVVGVAWMVMHRMDQSHWARHVRNGNLFHPYWNNADLQSTLEEDFQPPAYTLPNRHDVLIDSHYQSQYLASYADILRHNQPGNVKWNQVAASHAEGYTDLSPSLQELLCDHLIEDIMLRHHQARILEQTVGGRWSELSSEDASIFCHKTLVSRNNSILGKIWKELEHLLMETKFGAWRNSALHRLTIPNYIQFWMDLLYVKSQAKDELLLKILGKRNSTIGPAGARWFVRTGLAPLFTMPSPGPIRTASNMPSVPPLLEEPYDGAWFEVGETVEAKYRGMHQGMRDELKAHGEFSDWARYFLTLFLFSSIVFHPRILQGNNIGY